jgi:hypothetical protein
MQVNYYAGPPHAQDEAALPGVSASFEFSIWLSAGDSGVLPVCMTSICEAVSPLRCIGWYGWEELITDPKSSRPLAQSPHSKFEEIVAEGQLTYPSYGPPIRSLVGWMSAEGAADIIASLHGPGLRDGVIAFIPDEVHLAKKWARVAGGPCWLTLCKEWIANLPEPNIDADAVVLSFLKLTQEIGGVAGLSWTDTRTNCGLAFYGPSAILQPAAASLGLLSGRPSDVQWLEGAHQIGVSFDIASP